MAKQKKSNQELSTALKMNIPMTPSNGRQLTAEEVHRLHHPLESQITVALQAAHEISTQPYDSDFGKRAPARAALARIVSDAGAFSAQRARAEKLFDYLRSEEQQIWDEALVDLDELKDDFDLAAKADPTIVERYPALSSLLAARRDVANRGVATRAKNNKAKKNGGNGTK